MMNDFKPIIYEMFEQLDSVEDYRFLKQLYTLIKLHLKKKGKR